MSILTDLTERLRAFLRRDREDLELAEELRFHFEMEVEENLRRGLSPAEARRQAALRLGGMTQVQEAVRDARGVRWLDDIAQDVRYGLRGIRRNPLFATALVLTLGLGIGANAAMFSVVDALLLRPLPYGEPERLVEASWTNPQNGITLKVLRRDFGRAWAERAAPLFDGIMLHITETATYTEGAEPVMVLVEVVSPSFTEVLRVQPALGRAFEENDALPGAEPVVLLSHSFWRSAFGGDPGAVGRTIELDGIRHRIVGVMPAGFKFPAYGSYELWVPLRTDGTALGRMLSWFSLKIRLPATERLEAVQARVDALAASLEEHQPREGGWSVRLAPLQESRGGRDEVRRSVWFMAGAVTLILLVAALNAVNLMLVRAWQRVRELAVRNALGASRRRLLRQLLTESLLLAFASGVVAVFLAHAILRSMLDIMPGSITYWAPYAIEVQHRTLAFTFAAASAAGLLVGLVPALLATRMAAAARGALIAHATHSPAYSRLRRGLVVAEVALSVALLVGAGLMANSFVRLMRVDPGFRLNDVAILTLDLSPASYPTDEARIAFLRRIEERLEAMPGVVGATTGGDALPQGGIMQVNLVETDQGPLPRDGLPDFIPFTSVSPDFFDLLDVRILAGRPFDEADAGSAVAIIDVDLARRLWGEESPLGRRFRLQPDGLWYTVVGVIGDIRIMGPDDRQTDFEMLLPASRRASPYASIAIRTASDPRPLFPAIRAALRELDPRQPVSQLATAESIYAATVRTPRFLLVLLSVLSGFALLLAAIGVYGVLAYGVEQRRFELAVRLALGAPPAALSRRVLAEGIALAGVGGVLGVAGALSLSGVIRGFLFGVAPNDPLTIGAVAVVCIGSALVASWWPARRTTRIDPADVLRTV